MPAKTPGKPSGQYLITMRGSNSKGRSRKNIAKQAPVRGQTKVKQQSAVGKQKGVPEMKYLGKGKIQGQGKAVEMYYRVPKSSTRKHGS